MKLSSKIAREMAETFQCQIMEGISCFDLQHTPVAHMEDAERMQEILIDLAEHIIEMVRKKK